MLQDVREVRLEMTLNLCGPGTLFYDLGKEHLFRNLKAAFAVRRKVPGSFVERWDTAPSCKLPAKSPRYSHLAFPSRRFRRESTPIRHWSQNRAKTSDGRPTPTAIVFWQRGRGHNHQAGGRGKDKKRLKRREKMYVDRLQFTTVFLPLLSAG